MLIFSLASYAQSITDFYHKPYRLGTSLMLYAYAQVEFAADSVNTQPDFFKDTIQGIHQLFLTKRRGANIVTGVGVAVAGAGVLLAQVSYSIVNSVNTANGAKSLSEGPTAASFKASLPGILITTLAIIKRVRFNRRREEAVLSAYQQGRGLPPKIRQLLRPRYFQ